MAQQFFEVLGAITFGNRVQLIWQIIYVHYVFFALAIMKLLDCL